MLTPAQFGPEWLAKGITVLSEKSCFGRTLELAMKSQDYVIIFCFDQEGLINVFHVGTK